jgi:hypothetical protein
MRRWIITLAATIAIVVGVVGVLASASASRTSAPERGEAASGGIATDRASGDTTTGRSRAHGGDCWDDCGDPGESAGHAAQSTAATTPSIDDDGDGDGGDCGDGD